MTAEIRDLLPDQVGMAKPPMGTAVLNGLSSVSVSCPSITASSLVFISILVGSGTLGIVRTVSITPGVGFDVASIALNTSTIAWMVVEP